MYSDIATTKQALHHSADADLIRLVYVSYPTLKGRFNSDLFRYIYDKASSFNGDNNITGMLCYGGGYFFQCLEGSKLAVIELMTRIFKDDNHKVIQVIYASPAQQRLFSEWRMHCITLDRARWGKDCVQSKSQSLANFLPFEPRRWSSRTTESFLEVMQGIQTQAMSGDKPSSMTVLESGSMIGYARPPHAKFLIVQAVLALIAIALLLTVI